MATDTRDVSGFDRIVVDDYGELIVTQGAEESLTIDAADYIMPKIRAKVVDGKLSLGIEGSWLDKIGDAFTGTMQGKWIKYQLSAVELRGLHVRGALKAQIVNLTTDSLALRLTGAGSIDVDQLSAQSLKVDLTGAGSISARGSVNEQAVVLSGAGSYFSPKLETQKANIVVSGAGTATVSVSEDLKAAVRGVGSIEYSGGASVARSITGLGSIKPRDGE